MFNTDAIKNKGGDARNSPDSSEFPRVSYRSEFNEYFDTSLDWMAGSYDAFSYPPAFTNTLLETASPKSCNLESPASSTQAPFYPRPADQVKKERIRQPLTAFISTTLLSRIHLYLSQRQAQNRNSQRAFRKRQASYVSGLETKYVELQTKHKMLLECFHQRLRRLRKGRGGSPRVWRITEIVHGQDSKG
ncbi:hypothetical protein BKA61DRAFT_610367 [Leptodontidium sp. MPI-SDFR-AT-0119]|nr:hypothetical protein BKA61DRAFT_610367 [Leptodontidium sp. MPI-SDFR-AT-0119]